MFSFYFLSYTSMRGIQTDACSVLWCYYVNEENYFSNSVENKYYAYIDNIVLRRTL